MAWLFDTSIFSVTGSNSAIVPGATLSFYVTGTSTPLATYTDSGLGTPNANPVVADANARFPAIWMQESLYKVILKHSDGTTLSTLPDVRNPATGALAGVSALASDLTSTASGKGDILIGHIQSGTGAVAETVQTSLRRFVYAEQYSSVQAALNSVGATGGDVLLHKTSRLSVGNLTIPAGVRLLGQIAGNDITSDNITFTFNTLGSTLLTTAGTTITLEDGASIERVLLTPSAIGAVAQSTTASFAGTAITIAGYGARVENCTILGYAQAVTSNGYSRLTICNNTVDCQAAFDIQGSFDTTRILNNHCWPFLTHGAFWNSGVDYASRDKTKLYRTGIGLKLTNGSDDTRIDGNLFYGFLEGMELQNVSAVNMGSNWIDHPNGVNRASNIGARFRNNVSDTIAQTLMIYGVRTGVAFEMNAGESVSIDLLHVEATDDHAVAGTSGDYYIGFLDAQHIGNRALSIASASSKVVLDAYHFESITATEPISVPSGATLDKIRIGAGYWDGSAGAALIGANPLTPAVVASAATIFIPVNGDLFLVSGTTNISTIGGGWGGRRVTLIFQGILTVTDGAVLNIAGNFTTTANDVLELLYDGTQWLEIGRSVN